MGKTPGFSGEESYPREGAGKRMRPMRMSPRHLIALVSIVPLIAGLSGMSDAGAAVSPAGTASKIGLFCPDLNGEAATRTTAQWQSAATTFSILIGGKNYRPMVAQLHSWNPALTVLTYQPGPYVVKGSSTYNNLDANHPAYFARDSGGNL